MKLRLLISVLLILSSTQAFSLQITEPEFCKPINFIQTEITSKDNKDYDGVFRMHRFRLGKTILIGAAIGTSAPWEIKKLAKNYSPVDSGVGYCTWYLNKGNKIAEKEFNWSYVSKPKSDIQKTVDEYERILGPAFDQNSVSFISCMENHHYLAFGCNNQMHRGPSAFAMFLSFCGCTPTHSVAIADYYWNLNGVPYDTRLAIAQRGFELGEVRPLSRQRCQTVLSNRIF